MPLQFLYTRHYQPGLILRYRYFENLPPLLEPFGFGEVSFFSFHWHVEKKKWLHVSIFCVLRALINFTLRDTHMCAYVCVCVRMCMCVSVTNRKIAEFKRSIVTEYEANPTSPLSTPRN